MAALFNVADLRRHALPDHLARDLDRDIMQRERPVPPRRNGARPHLTAAWQVDAVGMLVCTWTLGTAAPGISSG